MKTVDGGAALGWSHAQPPPRAQTRQAILTVTATNG
jgi:hypothetical protein